MPNIEEIYNYLPLSDRIGTAGQPTEDQFAAIKAAGYEVVINLAMPDSPKALPNEADIATAQGLTYIPLPVVWTAPQQSDLEQFFQAMTDHQDKKCFVHCIANMRVSAFMFLYHVIQQGIPPKEARQAMNKIWEPNDVWQAFIQAALDQPSQTRS